jgi:glyoxylase-like metal-dependent hydrolase (beta-lactamase superfamily II)
MAAGVIAMPEIYAVAVSHLHNDHAGGFVFAFDAADLTENIEQELAVGGRINAGPEVSVAAIRKLKQIAAARSYPVIPGHDPVAWPALTKELGGVPPIG